MYNSIYDKEILQQMDWWRKLTTNEL